MDLNKAMIIGRLTRDPEVRTTPAGQTVASFGLATNRVWTNANGQKQEAVEYHNIVAWGKLAEICGQYLQKGRKAYVEGRLQTREWVGQDNAKRSRTEVVIENMIMLDAKSGNTGGGFPAPASRGFSEGEQPSASSEPIINVDDMSSPAGNPSEEEIKVENIPF